MTSTWNTFVAHHRYGHLLQTEEWAALKLQFGWESQLVTLREWDELVAGAQILFRGLPHRTLPLARVAYVPKGPVLDWGLPARTEKILNKMVEAASQRRAVFIRVEPNLLQGEIPDLEETLHQAGFQPAGRAIQPRRTILVDIRGSEEDVLQRMKQKTRYNIRLALRKRVVVRQGGAEDVLLFNRMVAATGRRHQFGVHKPAYYRAVYDLFSARDAVALLVAEYDGEPLAAVMVFALGETACYFYGASNEKERNRMPAFLLQWEAIRWARARGCTRYDLWGVPDESEETLESEFAGRSDGLWGVYRFKRGFGGRLVRWVGAFDRVFNTTLYRVVKRGGV